MMKINKKIELYLLIYIIRLSNTISLYFFNFYAIYIHLNATVGG